MVRISQENENMILNNFIFDIIVSFMDENLNLRLFVILKMVAFNFA